jgi:hypothetical protein
MMVAWATFLRRDFAVTSGKLTEFASSADVMRGFCGVCGSSLTYRDGARPDEIDVTIANLDEPLLFKPGCHLWVRDKLTWSAINDGLPQFESGPPLEDT